MDRVERWPEPAEYTYRRRLAAHELLPAVGAGIAVGLIGFYLARLFIQRTPLAAPDARRQAERG